MSKIYILRAILDAEEDVIRDVAISPRASLTDLHHLLVKAFELEAGEMSSFFKSNDNWDQGEEISMMDFDPETQTNQLDKITLEYSFPGTASKMLFVYDYLNLWTFYLELTSEKEEDDISGYPKIIARVGERPAKAPDKEMKAEDNEDFSSDWDIDEDQDPDYDRDDWY